MEVVYYWYHHGLAWNPILTKYYNDYNRIKSSLNKHNYERFMSMKAKYPDCLPNMACVYDGDKLVEHIDITIEENFMRITCADCECG